MILPGIMKSAHWGAAFDVRGLDQDLHIKGSTGGVGELFHYKETLDTTYYGGYFTIGGEYSLFPALYAGWGLRSFIDLHAGLTPTTTATLSAGESAAASSACLTTRSLSSAG